MESTSCPVSSKLRLQWRWLVVVSLFLSAPLWAQQDTFDNTGTDTDSGNINATNFVNESSGFFSMTTPVFLGGWNPSLYHGWYYTKNFTNKINGKMDCNTGFYFNTQTKSGLLNYPAANFYNAGFINCGVTNFDNFFFGGIDVWSSNILNAGTISIALDGLGQFSGNNLDFSGGVVALDNSLLAQLGFQAIAAGFGLNTNSAWNPGAELSAGSAYGSAPYNLSLPRSLAYLDFHTNNASSNVVIRAVFLENLSSNTVAANVYFALDEANSGLGAAYVEWSAAYVNPADGTTLTNYLYLNNNYNRSISTNIQSYNGIPDNFDFFTSSTSLSAGLTQVTNTGFPAGFSYPAVALSNSYSYVDAALASVTVATNETYPNNFTYMTNWFGRIEITASNALTFSQSTVQGANYLRLNSPNQFNNDGSSAIVAPFADAYLGATNGSLVISNVLASRISGWSGNIQAWSTDFTNGVDANGYTIEYKVLLVQSTVNPFNAAQQQDFVLYSSNNVVISDTLNVLRKFSVNCTNLLLTTNLTGTGAQSLDGEINLNYVADWATCAPRLSSLTNYGAIRTLTSANFGSASAPYVALFNSGLITNNGTAYIYTSDFENYGNFAVGGTLNLQSLTATMTNDSLLANGSINLSAASLVLDQTAIQSGGLLTLQATNLLTDGFTGITNGGIWILGGNYTGVGSSAGLVAPIKPAAGDLLGVIVTNLATTKNEVVKNVWPGQDRGYSAAGFKNNLALGQLVFDALSPNTLFQFTGTATDGSTNALYVDCLQFKDYATNVDGGNDYTNVGFATNIVIYYAQALKNGLSIADKLNHTSNDHFRWVPTYAGFYSSTNLVYPPGVTNTVNAALAGSTTIDSDGDGTKNASDPTPFFVPAQVNFTAVLTNRPPLSVRIQWATIPNATNYIYYSTNLAGGSWQPFTNFTSYYYSSNVAVANLWHTNAFVSPQPYGSPATNVWVFDPVGPVPHYYRVVVAPWLTYPF
jgi:hypothetical protein